MASLSEDGKNQLTQWLFVRLKPITDTDPQVLAEYVVQLLVDGYSKNDIAKELDDFIKGASADTFVDKMLTAVKG
jgi:PWI domain